jgi:hypothetical protein
LPTANLPLDDADGGMDLLLTHDDMVTNGEEDGARVRKTLPVCLIRSPF